MAVPPEAAAPLTRSERRILAAIVERYRCTPPWTPISQQEIARRAGCSPRAIKVHLHHLRAKRPGWIVNRTPGTKPCRYGLSDRARAMLR